MLPYSRYRGRPDFSFHVQGASMGSSRTYSFLMRLYFYTISRMLQDQDLKHVGDKIE